MWLIALLLISFFILTDAATVAWCAGLVSTSEIVASGLTFGLISLGLIATLWEMDR